MKAPFRLALALFLALVPAIGPAATMTDAVGRAVAVPDAPARIVSLAPGITEMLFAVGAGEQVVGVTDNSDFPPEALRLPRVGGFVNPSIEAVVSLRPDLVLATADGNRAGDVLALERLGLPVYVMDTRSLGDVYGAVNTVGKLVGREEAAGGVVAAMTGRYAALKGRLPAGPRPRVVFLVGRDPLIGVGPRTLLDELIREAGGENALAAAPSRYPLVGLESLLSVDPDVLILGWWSGEGGDGLPEGPGWETMRAVRSSRVHRFGDDAVLRPGPRIIDALERLAAILHEPGAAP